MKWVKIGLIILGFVAYSCVVWFAGPLIGFGEARPFDPVWVRLLLIGILLAILLIWALVAFLRRRKGQEALEKALVADPSPTGDGAELAGRMQQALATLKKSGNSKTYLYDLPWYVIIGPPGSGKTTALVNSEIKFPLAAQQQGGLQGFGGTRYCDWWFAEEAIIIDTAGRYTTQDSDQAADKASWTSFLSLLKKNRPKQPINGVILAFSVADLMRQEPEVIKGHAETVRARLAEIHETLKVDFPVYVMFTKADLISGFREYFGSFSASRRKKVWGATFQTSNRKEQTYDSVGPEFDQLVARLSDEVIDRLSEEPDGVNRIAIFGLPGQLAQLRETIVDFLRMVFEPTRYKTNAMLRGFYFTSGTQEGTPIDQVLGAMSRSFGGQDAGGLLSGKGKSYFLHDLMTKVIFGEQGWVSYDKNAVRRSSVLRIASMTAMILVSLVMMGLWGLSFMNNRAAVAEAEAALEAYQSAARSDLEATEISDTDFLRVAGHLQMLRNMPGGYGVAEEDEADQFDGFGLSQRAALRQAAHDSYGKALERLFRPRLVLWVEQELQSKVLSGEPKPIYETLKVYKGLGGAAPVSQDDLIRSWFEITWEAELYPGITQQPARDQLMAHLNAMLDLDGTLQPAVDLNGDLIDSAEIILGRLTVEEQAYSLIQASAPYSGIPDFVLVEQTGSEPRVVFETVDGSDLGLLSVPALYTYEGFHGFFLPQLAEVALQLESDQWVMGDQAKEADFAGQLDRLGPRLLQRYREDYVAAWEAMLSNIKLAPMTADKPTYKALGAASSPTTSPILRLVEAISRETRLTVAPATSSLTGDPLASAEAAALNGTGAVGQAAKEVENLVLRQTTGFQRIGLELALEAGKSQRRAGAGGGAGPIVPGADIEELFAGYHALLEGDPGSRPIDALLASLGTIYQTLYTSGETAEGAATMQRMLGQLTADTSRMPPEVGRMMAQAIEDFQGDAANATVAQMNEELTRNVVPRCEAVVTNRYPFGGNPSRPVPLSEFAEVFRPDGVLDRFFNSNLASLVNMGGKNWEWTEGEVGERMSQQTLRQFQRAAAIRDAFFPGRNPTLQLEVTINQIMAHENIKQAVLVVDGQVITTRQSGNTPVTIRWPDLSPEVSLSISPARNNRQSEVKFSGPWALFQFIREGNPRQKGDIIQVEYNLGGRNIMYEIRVNSLINPFNMSELAEFSCPTGL